MIDFEVRALKVNDTDVAIEFQRLSGDGLIFSRIFRDIVRCIPMETSNVMSSEQKVIAIEEEFQMPAVEPSTKIDTVVSNLQANPLGAPQFRQELAALLLRQMNNLPKEMSKQLSDQSIIVLLNDLIKNDCCPIVATLFSNIVENGNVSLLKKNLEQNFRVLSEMRILGKNRVAILVG